MGTFCIWDFAPSLKERSRYSCYYRMSFSCEVVSKIVCGPPSCWHFNYSSTDIFLSISLSSSIRRMTIFISFRQKNMMQDNIVFVGYLPWNCKIWINCHNFLHIKFIFLYLRSLKVTKFSKHLEYHTSQTVFFK